jgi:hypothetical protein
LGKEEVQEKLEKYIEKLFKVMEHDTILGLTGISLNWALFGMMMTGPPKLEVVLEWNDNVSSNKSFQYLSKHHNAISHPHCHLSILCHVIYHCICFRGTQQYIS